MTPVPVAPVSAALTASDWFAFLGVIVAAVLGVGVAVWGQWKARKAAERDSLDAALASVILALGERAVELEAWAAPAPEWVVGSQGLTYVRPPRGGSPGGPTDARLQTAVEVAWLLARTQKERACLEALAGATFYLKLASVRWQVARLGRVAAAVRKWRTGFFDDERFRADMLAHKEAAAAAAPKPDATNEEGV